METLTPTPILDSLPGPLNQISLRHLLVMKLESTAPTVVGQTPTAFRRVGTVPGGLFESRIDGLNGIVMPGGNDWQSVRTDHATTLDVRLLLKTDAGDLIAVTYRGVRHGDASVLAKLDRGDQVDPASYYFRSAAFLETASERFAWLNRIIAVGTGHRYIEGPVYNLFEVL